jgi:hypothetical protein
MKKNRYLFLFIILTPFFFGGLIIKYIPILPTSSYLIGYFVALLSLYIIIKFYNIGIKK